MKLPNGQIAKSEAEYAREWIKLGDKVAGALGCRLIGVDPGFLMIPTDKSIAIYGAQITSTAFTLPLLCALKISALIDDSRVVG